MRQPGIDVLKAVALGGVIAFHLGLQHVLPAVRVDLLLVVAGYFALRSLDRHAAPGRLAGALAYARHRLLRLWPLLAVCGLTCLAAGYWLMLPDDFENLAQSHIATMLFGNNWLSAATVHDYWSPANNYRPLMHTWFIGALVQAEAVLLLLWVAACAVTRSHGRRLRIMAWATAALTAVSLVLYLPVHPSPEVYYSPVLRFFEVGAGALVYVLWGRSEATSGRTRLYNTAFVTAYILLLCALFVPVQVTPGLDRTVAVVVLSGALLVLIPRASLSRGRVFGNRWLAAVGTATFSLYMWHQPVIAFARYSFTDHPAEWPALPCVLALTALLAWVTHRHVERLRPGRAVWAAVTLGVVVSLAWAWQIYRSAGVVRNVPELQITRGSAHRGQWAEYCDEAYAWNRPYARNGRQRWCVVGNSFGRDFVNMAREAGITDSVDLVYVPFHETSTIAARVPQAHKVFVALSHPTPQDIDAVRRAGARELYVVGIKNFGESAGRVYSHRYLPDYYTQTVAIAPEYHAMQRALKAAYGQRYIDILSLVQDSTGRVRVFTPDSLLISQDGHHLTRAGARWLGSRVPWHRWLSSSDTLTATGR